MIDLFSGFGGASEAFRLEGWSVLRYDNNPALQGVPGTTLCDLMEYEIKCRHPIEIIWASPPCLAFSTAFLSPKSKAARAGEDYKPDMKLITRAIQIIEELKPKHWIIEGVAGGSKDFEKLLGPPRQIIGPFLLWGVFPFIHVPKDWQHFKSENDKRHSDLRANYRAKIPIQISAGLLEAVTTQRTLAWR